MSAGQIAVPLEGVHQGVAHRTRFLIHEAGDVAAALDLGRGDGVVIKNVDDFAAALGGGQLINRNA